jgi:hypothetical protein
MSRSSESDGLKIALSAMGFGVYFFWLGFKKLKVRRKMGDIPTSKISSAAVGSFVEIKGRVVCEETDFISTPLSNKKGVCFIWHIEKLVKSGKNSKWVTEKIFYSCPFLYVKDHGDHLAAIDLANCDFQEDIYDHHVQFNNSSFDLPHAVQGILREYRLLDLDDKASFLTSRKYRIKEKVFKRHEPIYVLGSVVAPPETESARSSAQTIQFGTRNKEVIDEVQAILKVAKLDPQFRKMYDKDNNSALDDVELKRLHQDIQKKIFTDYNLPHQNSYLEKSKLFFTMVEDHENVFSMKKVIVSLQSEQKLSKKLLLQASAGLAGGPLLFVLGLYVLFDFLKV